jgi:hypothetical protein
VGFLTAKRWVNKLHAVALFDFQRFEILAICVATVYFNYYGRIVFVRTVQKLLHCYTAAFILFWEPVELEFQLTSSSEREAGFAARLTKRSSPTDGYCFFSFIAMNSRSELTGNSLARTPVAS